MRSNIKGGSKASDLVMSTNPVLCGDESPVLLGKQFDYDPKQLTLYNTTGGARKSIRKRSKGKSKGKSKSIRKRSMRKHKSKSLRKRSMRKRKSKGKSKSFRKKKGGSKASNAVLKGFPCNANNLVGGSTNNAFVQNNCRGKSQSGGSDWRSTVYSRGSASAPNMPMDQFRAFTQTGDYVANESMSSAAFMK
jgi:hypothetical protein